MVAGADLPDPVKDSRWEVDFQPNPYYPSQVVNTQPSGRRLLRQEIWIREKILGHGGFGVVWLEKAHSSNQLSARVRAVKELKLGQEDDRRRECIQELEALIKFSHRKFVDSFVEFYSWFESQDALFIATEYCEHGDLRQFVNDNGCMSEQQAQDITDQVLQGIIFMHDSGFAHRDLKPANILIKKRPPDDEWHVKICDMGLSKRINAEKASTTIKGTPGFVAPERIPGIGSSPSTADPFPCDMWCLGETAFFLLTGGTSFENYSKLQDYVNGTLEFPRQRLEVVGASQSATGFIKLLMAVQPSKRLSANQADYHQWITSIINTVRVPPRPLFDELPSRPRPTAQYHADRGDRPTWRAGTSIGTTMQDGEAVEPPPPPGSLQETTTVASGSWGTVTHPIPHFEGNDHSSTTTSRQTSATLVGNIGTAENDMGNDTQAQVSPPPSDSSYGTSGDNYSDWMESTASGLSIQAQVDEFERYNFPSLWSFLESKSEKDRKYVFRMRAAIRYIIGSGGFREKNPDCTHAIASRPASSAAAVHGVQEDEAFLSDSQASDLDDDDHAAKRTRFNAQVDGGCEEEDVSLGGSRPPVPGMEETSQSGGGAATTNYRQPTVEDVQDSE